jgi:hypothetical protein
LEKKVQVLKSKAKKEALKRKQLESQLHDQNSQFELMKAEPENESLKCKLEHIEYDNYGKAEERC